MKNFFFFLILMILTISCKDKRETELTAAGARQEMNSIRPDWVEKVGAKPIEFKKEVFYVNDYDAIDDGSQLTTAAIVES